MVDELGRSHPVQADERLGVADVDGEQHGAAAQLVTWRSRPMSNAGADWVIALVGDEIGAGRGIARRRSRA